jgi:hypothetical protein
MVETPVGARCPTCAGVKRFRLLIKPAELARAIGFGIAVGAVGTVIYTFIPFLGPLISLAIIGFGVGHAVLVAAHRKRARELAPIAVACLFVGYEIGLVGLNIATGAPFGLPLLLAPLFALRQIQVLIGLLVGSLLAWMRTR